MNKRFLLILGSILVVVLVGLIGVKIFKNANVEKECIDSDCNETNSISDDNNIPLINSQIPIDTVPIEKFTADNLEYSSSFISYTITQDIIETKTKAIITKISYADNKLDITLQRVQKCNEKQELLGQNAKYYTENSIYFLTYSYQEEKEGYDKECVVKARYLISNQISLDTASIKVISNIEDIDEELSFCKNTSSLYANGEVFLLDEECMTCECKNGEITCNNMEACEKKKEEKKEQDNKNLED